MNTKKVKQNKPTAKPNPGKSSVAAPQANPMLKYGILTAVLIVTFICFHNSLSNQFTNWDDGYYVVKNQYIKSFSAANLKMMMFHDITNNYYHPLTMLSLAANYHFSGLNPSSYYLTNIFIHLLNTCLVFWLVILLFNAMAKAGYRVVKEVYWLAGVCALLHGIHPMHVESVSWISERKDVLYTLFYFAGLISYMFYVRDKKIKYYLIVVLLFILSMLSKPMAVVFPLSLFAIDFLLKRKNLKTLFLEKAPLLAVSIIGGIITFKLAAGGGSVTSFSALPFTYRILFASYGYTMYLVKFLFPFNLSAFYPYPELATNIPLPSMFYAMPVTAILLGLIPFYFKLKKKENLFRITLFGLGFYLFNILFVLQFVSAGGVIMADRYSYVSYFGLIFMVVYLLNEWQSSNPKLKYAVVGILSGVSLLFSVLCLQRTKVWHDGESLWTDVLSKYPGPGSQIAYMNMGDFYADKGDTANAFKNYNILEGMHTRFPTVYKNLADIYAMRGQTDKALAEYATAISCNDSLYTIYLDRAVTYNKMNRFDLAIRDYGEVIKYDPNEAMNYLLRGNDEMQIQAYNLAVADYLHYLQLQPTSSEVMYNLSLAYHSQGNNADALKYALMAQNAGYKLPDGYLNILK